MINGLQKGLVDLIYGVGPAKTKYEKENPTEKVVAADGSKAITTTEDKDIERGLDWVGSKRAVVMLTNKRLKCDNWDIPLENIETAKLVKLNSFFGDGQLLKIKTKDNTYYQFGMQFNPEWTDQIALPLTLEQGKIKTSTFSFIIRLVAIGYLIYWILSRFEII